jgi:hypothetical protein
MHEIVLGENLFVHNKLMISNSPSVNKIQPFSIPQKL